MAEATATLLDPMPPFDAYAAVKALSANIMIADQDRKIVYINETAMNMMAQHRDLLTDRFNVNADRLEGSPFDVFYGGRADSVVKKLKQAASTTVKTTVVLDPTSYELHATRMTDATGNLTGFSLVWNELGRANSSSGDEIAQHIVDNAPFNIMVATRDGVITSMNPASSDTLQKLASLLPIPVDKIIGANIDVFHKNPKTVRRIISNPDNMPHFARFKLGEHILELSANALFDSAGDYTGPMVTWAIVTENEEMLNALQTSGTDLTTAAQQLNSLAESMATNSSATSEKIMSTATATEEISAGIDNVNNNMNDLQQAIQDITRQTADSSTRAKEAMQVSLAASKTIEHLGASSVEIGNVIKVISSIAQQTNLLSLNATIEAARAGEAGKGFAVVANEVKELAKETAKATEEITDKIEGIQKAAKDAVKGIGNVSASIDSLNEISIAIAAAVEEQAATTDEVARVVKDTNAAINTISQDISEVTRSADQVNRDCSETVSAADALDGLAQRLGSLVQNVRNSNMNK